MKVRTLFLFLLMSCFAYAEEQYVDAEHQTLVREVVQAMREVASAEYRIIYQLAALPSHEQISFMQAREVIAECKVWLSSEHEQLSDERIKYLLVKVASLQQYCGEEQEESSEIDYALALAASRTGETYTNGGIEIDATMGQLTLTPGSTPEGDGGSVVIGGADAATATLTAHNGGSVMLSAGAATGAGTPGTVTLATSGGAVQITPGSGAQGGAVLVYSGSGTSASGSAGMITIDTGYQSGAGLYRNGTIAIGTNNAATLQLGNASSTTTVAGTLSLGNLTVTGTPTLSVLGTGVVHANASGVLSSSAIVNADVSASAAIDRSKLAPGSANHVLIHDGSGVMSSEATLVVSRGGTGASTLTSGQLLVGAGTSAVTFQPFSSANTASAVVQRDASGNFAAGTITASLTGAASLNVLKAGDTMTGTLTMTPSAGAIVVTGSNTTSAAVQVTGGTSSGTGLVVDMDAGTGKGLQITTAAGVNAIEVNPGAPKFTVDGTTGNMTVAGNSVLTGTVMSPGVRATNLGTSLAMFINAAGQMGVRVSSRRYKEQIEDMAERSEVLAHLRPVVFRYTHQHGSGPLQYGMIAEEVARVAPDVVVYNEDGIVESIAYDEFVPMLVNEYQKQQRVVAAQQTQMNELREELVALKRLLAARGMLA